MTTSELYKRGLEMRKTLRGEESFKQSEQVYGSDPLMKEFIDVATEGIFGVIWTRPGLDLKTRTMVTVVSDASTGRYPELEIHLGFALRQGWTEEELKEALLHLIGYVGAPVIRDAMLVASEVFKKHREGTL